MSFVATGNEMPQWVERCPTNWNCQWLKWNVQLRTMRPSDTEAEELPYISNEDVESWTGRLLKDDPKPSDSEGRLFHAGDVLFNKLRPYLAKVYYAGFDGVSSGELLCLSPSQNVLARYLFYVLASRGFIDAVDSETFGSKMPRADWAVVGHQPLPLPPLKTQHRIARFLDAKTARIDALIEKKRALLDRLAEKRQALITHAVTKGLNPDVPMKDSGIDWLGDIPAHWETLSLRFLADVVLGLTYSLDDVADESNGVLVLRSSNIQRGSLVHADDVFVSSKITDNLVCRSGDIVICSRNGSRRLIGKCAIVTETWAGVTFGAFMTVVRSKYSEWLLWVLSSRLFSFQAGRYMSSTINQLTTDALKSFPLPIPPAQEQRKIAKYVNEQCLNVDRLSGKIRKSIERLSEYRSALITAAVTGQLDMSNVDDDSIDPPTSDTLATEAMP